MKDIKKKCVAQDGVKTETMEKRGSRKAGGVWFPQTRTALLESTKPTPKPGEGT